MNELSDLATIDPEELNRLAESKSREFVNIKTNQIRIFFSAVSTLRQHFRDTRRYDKELERSLILLKPRLAYAAGRQPVVKPFQAFMTQAIDGVTGSENRDLAVRNFFSLVEAVVAYHKFHGGKEN